MSISTDTVISRNESVMFTDLGETVITMNIDSGYYHELNAVASRIWQIIETPKSVQQVCAQLVDEYDVGAEECERDVVEFLGDFDRLRLVDVAN